MPGDVIDGQALWQLGALDLHSAIRKRVISVTDVVTSAVDRLHEVNGAINAVTADLSDIALKRAASLDSSRRSDEKELPALFGVPVTVKQNVDQQGQSTNSGVEAYANLIAERNSPVVSKLVDAGSVIIGRTNTPEFSLRFMTDNPMFGLTQNPWCEKLTCGGSSGGAAAAVALGIGAIAHGNDVGGSLRYPAYCCGIAAIKPTVGRVPAFNFSQKAERSPIVQMMSVQGALARHIGDLRLALNVMTGQSAFDPLSTGKPVQEKTGGKPHHVGMTYGVFEHELDPRVKDAIDRAAKHLSDAGYIVEIVDPPHLHEAGFLWRSLIMTEVQTYMGPVISQVAGEEFQQIMDDCYQSTDMLDLHGYMGGLSRRLAIIRDWQVFLDKYPLVLAPVSSRLPFGAREDTEGADKMRYIFDAQSPLGAVNLLGLPAVAVPVMRGTPTPVGVQLISAAFQEELCLDAAEAIENAAGVFVSDIW